MHQIKKTYICKEISDFVIKGKIDTNYKPIVGDVAVFEIIELGKHRNIQSESRRNMTIISGDRIMAAFGNRYATNQFEGYVPESLDGELHILGAGGIVGHVKSMHYNLEDYGPTTVRFVGLVTDANGKVYNTKEQKKSMLTKFSGEAALKTKVIISLGSSMDSGKTTTAAYLVNGLMRAGYKVAFGKLTGTVYTKDLDLNADLGAQAITDFSDFGFPSTYLCGEDELLDLYESVLLRLNESQPDFTILEIADGLYQKETKFLFNHQGFVDSVHAFIFSANDSLSAIQGVNVLGTSGIVPFALSGMFTASPLLMKEVKEHLDSDIPVYNILDLSIHAAELLKGISKKTAMRKLA